MTSYTPERPLPWCRCGAHHVLIADQLCPICDDDDQPGASTSRTEAGDTARENREPTATVYSTEHRQPPSSDQIQPDADPAYQRPSSCSTSTSRGWSYRRHQLLSWLTGATVGGRP